MRIVYASLFVLLLTASSAAGDAPAERQKTLPTITRSFEDADVVEIIKVIAEQGQLNVVVSTNVQGKLTIAFEDVYPMVALEQAAWRVGAFIRSDRGVRSVRPLSERKLGQHFYRFRHWHPRTEGPSADENDVLFRYGIAPLVRREGGSLRYIKKDNAIAFTATSGTGRAIEVLLGEMDRKPASADSIAGR